MLFFMVENHKFVLTNASPDTVTKFWNTYHAFRYDFDFSFPRFLQENGIYARVASPFLSSFGYCADDIEVSLN